MKRQSQNGKPFFLYLPYTATHYPTRPHPDFAGKTGNGNWADLLLQIDTYTGRLLDVVSRGPWKKNGTLHSVIRVSYQAATSACSRTSLRRW